MAVTIASEVRAQIVGEAERSAAVEICGLLVGRDGVVARAIPCTNVAADRARRFEIDPAALLAAHRAARGGGPAVIGHYHSHPTGRAEPSPRDAADAAPDGSLWLIATPAGALTAWRAVPAGALHGRFDPVGLRDAPDAATEAP